MMLKRVRKQWIHKQGELLDHELILALDKLLSGERDGSSYAFSADAADQTCTFTEGIRYRSNATATYAGSPGWNLICTRLMIYGPLSPTDHTPTRGLHLLTLPHKYTQKSQLTSAGSPTPPHPTIKREGKGPRQKWADPYLKIIAHT